MKNVRYAFLKRFLIRCFCGECGSKRILLAYDFVIDEVLALVQTATSKFGPIDGRFGAAPLIAADTIKPERISAALCCFSVGQVDSMAGLAA